MVLAPHKPLLAWTAGELMSRTVVMVPKEMSLQGAARLLAQAGVTGAPVVDGEGRCVGVLSATDFLHWVQHNGHGRGKPKSNQVCSPWQILDAEALPEDAVCKYMTADPVMVSPGLTLAALARMMVDAHIHRVIVVDQDQRPVGIVSTTDILAALAKAGQGEEPSSDESDLN